MKSLLYAGAGMLLGVGAPVGYLIVRALQAQGTSVAWALGEISEQAGLYAYMSGGTVIAFGLFGFVLGRHADALEALAGTDPLTGLLNRRAFEERLRDEVARARRYGTPLALLLIDVDGFKAINDRRGHHAGDEALQSIGRSLRAGSRTTDVTGRWGGDEFVCLAPEARRAEALDLAERFRIAVGAAGSGLTVSIGVATADHGTPPAQSLEEVADAAMYEAKRRGGNRVVLAG